MIRLEKALKAWRTPDFNLLLKQGLEQLSIEQLPLVEAMRQGSVPIEGSVEVMVHRVSETDETIQAKVGIFFQSVIAGCSCSDDPTPTDRVNEYGEVELVINRITAEIAISLTSE